MKVHQIINSLYKSNTFILSGDDNVYWLVDVGDIAPILKYVGDGVVKGLFLTHTHYDHIYGINHLLTHFPDISIYTNEFGRSALQSPKLNYSRYHQDVEDLVCAKMDNVVICREGDTLMIAGNKRLSIIETPGHDKSCLCFQTEDTFFSGDSYIPGTKIFTSFLHGNKMDAQTSLEKIVCLSRGKRLYPGHGNPIFIQ